MGKIFICIYDYELLISSIEILKRDRTLHVKGQISHLVSCQEKSPSSCLLASSKVSQSEVQGLFLNKHIIFKPHSSSKSEYLQASSGICILTVNTKFRKGPLHLVQKCF